MKEKRVLRAIINRLEEEAERQIQERDRESIEYTLRYGKRRRDWALHHNGQAVALRKAVSVVRGFAKG